jgi:hypothetical protein
MYFATSTISTGVPIMIIDDLENYQKPTWKISRLLFLARLKNHPRYCHFAGVPLDIIRHIISLYRNF